VRGAFDEAASRELVDELVPHAGIAANHDAVVLGIEIGQLEVGAQPAPLQQIGEAALVFEAFAG
jgi:hypothetical protein